MGKLLKYEFIRSKLFLMICFFLFFGIEGVFLFGAFTNNEDVITIAVSFLVMAASYGFIAIFVQTISSYYNDLKQKHGYMLFLTPRNGFEIVGSKICHSLLVLFAGGILFAGFAILDFSFLVKLSDEAWSTSLFVEAILEDFDWSGLLFFLDEFLALLSTLLTIYFAITLGFTFLNGKRGKGFLCFLIYLIIDMIVSGITDTILAPVEESFYVAMESVDISSYYEMLANGGMSYVLLSIGIHVVVIAGMYIGTSVLIDKKLSL